MNQQPEPEQELKPASLLWSIVRKLDALHADLTKPRPVPKPILWLLGLIALLLGLVLWRVW